MDIAKLSHDRLFVITPTPLMVLDRALCFAAANDCYLSVTAKTRDELIGRHVFDAFPETEERRVMIRGAFERALAGEANKQPPHPYAIERPGEGIQDVWWETEQLPVPGADGSVIGLLQHSRDVTEQVTAQRMRDVISQEYDHRVRNMLAKVSAVARRTAHGASNLKQFIDDFDPRITAMARAHSLLVHGGWERLSLSELLHGELQPYIGGASTQVTVSGPEIALSSHVAQALGMALHELVTNAAKYGALSHAGGHLDINWSSGATDGALRLRWTETGAVSQPRRPDRTSQPGFGSTIIDRVLPAETGGSVDRAFTPAGMVCTIEIPVPTRS